MPKKNKYPWYKARQCYRKQVKMPDGAYRTLYAKTEGEMDTKLGQLKAEIAYGISSDNDPDFIQYAKNWFSLNTAELSDARISDYRIALNKYIIPALAGKKIREIIQEDGKRILVSMAGRSRSLQGNVVYVLKRIFDAAEENQVIIKSPFSRLKAGGKLPDEKTPLTDEQSAILIETVRNTRAHPFIMIALYAGLRREEILGLRWENVYLDVKAPYIAVRERVTFAKGGKSIHEVALKSKASRRNIPIPGPLLTCLAGLGRTSDFVVPGASGRPQNESAFNSMWRSVRCRTVRDGIEPGSTAGNHPDVVRAIDFHVSPHILRHTYITNLCRSGLNLKIIQYLAGHAKAQLTLNIYIHATENQPEDLADIINSAFTNRYKKDTKADTKVVDIRQVIAAQ